MESVLTRSQIKTFGPRAIAGWGKDAYIIATVRFDDQCGNGHNMFSVTGEIWRPKKQDCEACGQLHGDIACIFPELAPFLQWHLTSTDGPMHYIANTTYWAEQGNLEYARNTAVWPDASLEELKDRDKLAARLPKLMAEFERDVRLLGFEY